MKPSTPDEVIDLLESSFASTALGTAIELGLFWLLEKKPLDAREVARHLGIPPVRCHYWLQLLHSVGLIEQGPSGYIPSATARTAILDVYSQDSWQLLAEGERERLPDLCDLPNSIRKPGAAVEARRRTLPEYVAKMDEKPEWAVRFTRMLYELHQPLADHLAESLDLTDVDRLLDLGGGSGVVALSLLRRNPQLTAVVVDIGSVCSAARTIAEEHSLGDRVVYHAANFLRDDLPSGFDMVLECDVNTYSKALFHKVWNALNPGGRFVIVDQLSPDPGVAPFSRLHWAFQNSLKDPEFRYSTAAELEVQLTKVGFQIRLLETLPPISLPTQRFTSGLTMIEARRNCLTSCRAS